VISRTAPVQGLPAAFIGQALAGAGFFRNQQQDCVVTVERGLWQSWQQLQPRRAISGLEWGHS
jgi:hypothetical protein